MGFEVNDLVVLKTDKMMENTMTVANVMDDEVEVVWFDTNKNFECWALPTEILRKVG